MVHPFRFLFAASCLHYVLSPNSVHHSPFSYLHWISLCCSIITPPSFSKCVSSAKSLIAASPWSIRFDDNGNPSAEHELKDNFTMMLIFKIDKRSCGFFLKRLESLKMTYPPIGTFNRLYKMKRHWKAYDNWWDPLAKGTASYHAIWSPTFSTIFFQLHMRCCTILPSWSFLGFNDQAHNLWCLYAKIYPSIALCHAHLHHNRIPQGFKIKETRDRPVILLLWIFLNSWTSSRDLQCPKARSGPFLKLIESVLLSGKFLLVGLMRLAL